MPIEQIFNLIEQAYVVTYQHSQNELYRWKRGIMDQQPPYGQPPYGQQPEDQQHWSQQLPPYRGAPLQPGQFQPLPSMNFPPPQQRPRGLWTWYKTRTRNMKLGLGCGTIVAILILCSGIATAFSSVASFLSQPSSSNLGLLTTPHATSTSPPMSTISPIPTFTPTPAEIPTLTPTPTPTPKPTPMPTPTPKPPTPTPTPCIGVNGNPWCYDFNPGKYITSPPSRFCSYFNCISSFWNGKGYVVECKDEMYSKSGSLRGVCSSHGGYWRTLYSH